MLETQKAILPFFTLIIVYLFLGLSSFAGIWAYVVPSICWIILAVISIKTYTLSEIKGSFSKNTTLLAIILATTQLMLLVFIAIFTVFGRSPYTSGVSALNILFFASTLLGTELARAQIIRAFPKQRKFLGLILVALLFAFIAFLPAQYLRLGEPAETVKFFGGSFLPTIASSLLATLLALLGGPFASLTYTGTLQGFEWFSPILPNPDWTIQALVGIFVPVCGFMLINQTTKPAQLLHHGLLNVKEATQKRQKREKFPFGWIGIALVALVLMWGSSGLLGFQPSVVASGSMQPNLNVGDMAIVVHCKPADIQVGDIVQYRGANEPVIHRVIDKYSEGGQTFFVTKGDANGAADPNPVGEAQVIGKEAFNIPMLGWVSIWLKNAGAILYNVTLMLPQALSAGFGWLTSSGVYLTAPLVLVVLAVAVTLNIKGWRKSEP